MLEDCIWNAHYRNLQPSKKVVSWNEFKIIPKLNQESWYFTWTYNNIWHATFRQQTALDIRHFSRLKNVNILQKLFKCCKAPLDCATLWYSTDMHMLKWHLGHNKCMKWSFNIQQQTSFPSRGLDGMCLARLTEQPVFSTPCQRCWHSGLPSHSTTRV